jgi:hypothetical protein
VEGHAEPAADQLGDAAGGPQVSPEPVCRRLLGQPVADLPVLRGGEEARSPRSRPGSEAGVASGSVPGHPLGYRDGMNPEGLRNGGLGLPAQDPLNGQSSYRFQGGGRSFASHAEEDSRLRRA